MCQNTGPKVVKVEHFDIFYDSIAQSTIGKKLKPDLNLMKTMLD